MKKRRGNILPLALLFFAILGLNICVYNSTARTNIDKTIIEHTQLEFFVPGKRILMQTNISDPVGIAEARLYFGTSKATKNLVFSKMKSQTGDSYVGIIPAPSSETEKIYYCFLAVNYNGDVVKTGLFELQATDNVGFIPTWQGDLKEYGNTLSISKEPTQDASESIAIGLEGFADSIVVNVVKHEEKYYASKKVQNVPGLSTIDGGDVEPAEGEAKDEGWSKNEKIAAGAGAGALAIGLGVGLSGGGGGGGGGCSYSICDDIDDAPCEGASYCCDVTTSSTCEWSVVSNDRWIGIVSGETGTGSDEFCFTLDENSSSDLRTGTIDLVIGESTVIDTLTITQEGCCIFTSTPTDPPMFPPEGGDGCFDVEIDSGCSWNASPDCGWVDITSGSSGSGNGEVCYTVDQHTGVSPRSCTITVNSADDEFTVDIDQDGVPIITVSDATVTNVGTGGEIDFDPEEGMPGDSVSLNVSFTNLPGLGDKPWDLKVKVNGESKTEVCGPGCAGGFNIDMIDLFKFTSSGTTNRVRIFVNLEDPQGKTKIYDADVPLEFK